MLCLYFRSYNCFKLENLEFLWQWSRPFSGKSPPQILDTEPSDLIISDFTQFEQPFSLQNSKRTYSASFKSLPMYLKFNQNFSAEALKVSGRGEKISTIRKRNKLFILHGLINPFYPLFMQYSTPSLIRTVVFPIQKNLLILLNLFGLEK